MPKTKALVLAVIDGLTPAMLERGLEQGRLPALRYLAEAGTFGRGTSVFPSLTPVCLASIATGAYPDVHHIPHLVWYHRGEERLVEYGSSFAAMRAAGARRAIRDSIFSMNHEHLAAGATTVFEALEDAGLTPAAINFTCYRGRTRHPIRLPGLARRNRWYEAAYGPKRFFFFNLFESDVTGAPLAIRSRLDGSIDEYAATVGRWLVTRDGFDFLVFYLPDYDYASHLAGPESALDALERSDRALAEPHGGGGRLRRVPRALRGSSSAPTTARQRSNGSRRSKPLSPRERREGSSSRPRTGPGRSTAWSAALTAYASSPSASTASRRRTSSSSARTARPLRGEKAPTFASPRSGAAGGSTETSAVLDPLLYPNGLERAWRALACPTAGDVLVSAAEGWEFADLGGAHHLGGGSHGSLLAGDSIVPLIAAGLRQGPVRRLREHHRACAARRSATSASRCRLSAGRP